MSLQSALVKESLGGIYNKEHTKFPSLPCQIRVATSTNG